MDDHASLSGDIHRPKSQHPKGRLQLVNSTNAKGALGCGSEILPTSIIEWPLGVLVSCSHNSLHTEIAQVAYLPS